MGALRTWPLALIGCLALAREAPAQIVDPVPLHSPKAQATAEDAKRREALHHYARGAQCEHAERLIEAMRAYEESLANDPSAVPVMRALALLYVSIERYDDAIALTRKVLDADPADFHLAFLYSRQLRGKGQLEEAAQVLLAGMKSPRLQDRLDLHQQMLYDLGSLYERLDRPVDAASAFADVAAILELPESMFEGRINPQEIPLRLAEARERQGRNLLEARQYADAVSAFRKAQKAFPGGANRLHFHLAQVQVRQGKLPEALVDLDQYLLMLPQGLEAYDLKIGLLAKLRREREIIPWLERASEQDRFNVGLRLLLARQCARLGDPRRAEKIYGELAGATPTEQLYTDWLGMLLASDPSRALALIDATLTKAARKDDPLATTSAPAQARAIIACLRNNAVLSRQLLAIGDKEFFKDRHGDTLQLLAALADRFGTLEQAEFCYRECLKLPLTAAAEPLVYGSLLRVQWKARRYEAIIETCRFGLAHAEASNRVLLRADLARALAALERHEDALAEIDAALDEAKGNEKFACQHLRVRVLTQANKLARAEAECKALLETHVLPGEVLEIRYLLSHVYSQGKRLADAVAELEACLRIDSANASVLNDLGYLLADHNRDLPRAEELIRKAIDLDRRNRQQLLTLRPDEDKTVKDNACYIDSLGWVLYRRGQFDEARKQLELAGGLPEGDDPLIWDHLGDVYVALREPDRAIAAWQKSLGFYERGPRRKMDDRQRMLREKLKRLQTSQTP